MVNCENCRDTGRKHLSTDDAGVRKHSPYLDCTAPGCNAAIERADLGEAFPLLAKDWPECLWQVHQRARKMECEAGAARIAELEAEVKALRAQKDKA